MSLAAHHLPRRHRPDPYSLPRSQPSRHRLFASPCFPKHLLHAHRLPRIIATTIANYSKIPTVVGTFTSSAATVIRGWKFRLLPATRPSRHTVAVPIKVFRFGLAEPIPSPDGSGDAGGQSPQVPLFARRLLRGQVTGVAEADVQKARQKAIRGERLLQVAKRLLEFRCSSRFRFHRRLSHSS